VWVRYLGAAGGLRSVVEADPGAPVSTMDRDCVPPANLHHVRRPDQCHA